MLRRQSIDQWPGEARISIPQYAGVPGATGSLPHRCVGVDRKEHGGQPGRHHRLNSPPDRLVVRAVEPVEPALALNRIERRIAGYDRAVRQAHDESRIIFPAVRIDEEAGEATKNCRCTEAFGKHAGKGRRPYVKRDMSLELVCRKAQIMVLSRHTIAGVIDEDQEAACIVALEILIGIRPCEPPGLDRIPRHCHTPGSAARREPPWHDRSSTACQPAFNERVHGRLPHPSHHV